LAMQRQQLASIRDQIKTLEGSLQSKEAAFADLSPEKQQAVVRILEKKKNKQQLTKDEADLARQFDPEGVEENHAKKGREDMLRLGGEFKEEPEIKAKRKEEAAATRRVNVTDQLQVDLSIKVEEDTRAAIDQAAKSNDERFAGGEAERKKIVKEATEAAIKSPEFAKMVNQLVEQRIRRLRQAGG
jgi:hypothetical protein